MNVPFVFVPCRVDLNVCPKFPTPLFGSFVRETQVFEYTMLLSLSSTTTCRDVGTDIGNNRDGMKGNGRAEGWPLEREGVKTVWIKKGPQ